jgi:hypothetical protein
MSDRFGPAVIFCCMRIPVVVRNASLSSGVRTLPLQFRFPDEVYAQRSGTRHVPRRPPCSAKMSRLDALEVATVTAVRRA